ncbi:MAG: hypothetical protein IPI57_12840 [Candidatus Competibacteraceae bacterium]|nr:hypothetical protein [Candidatus Competibacteraceae bacterium]
MANRLYQNMQQTIQDVLGKLAAIPAIEQPDRQADRAGLSATGIRFAGRTLCRRFHQPCQLYCFKRLSGV